MTAGRVTSLSSLTALMRDLGAQRILFKFLAENDNSKNQIYLGSDFAATNVLPSSSPRSEVSPSTGKSNFKAALDLWWVDATGASSHAASAQLILYPEYPEVRLSGFLRGSRLAPDPPLLRSRTEGAALFLGIREDGRLLAYASGANDATTIEARALEAELSSVGVFKELPVVRDRKALDPKQSLLDELRRIHLKQWIEAKRLRPDGSPGPCTGQNCGGYTLEAELGIRPNGISDPDFLGWEVKQHGVASFGNETGTPITLMTPEPTEGVYADAGLKTFLRRFGYADKRGRQHRTNFGGVYRVGRRVESTGLTLVVEGFDAEKRLVTSTAGGVCLVSDRGEVAARWPFAGLMAHWNRKHARAAYIPSETRSAPRRAYRYGSRVRLGESTDFLLFLAAMAAGKIFYDPALKLVTEPGSKPVSKKRNQFRVKLADLSSLYKTMEQVNLV